MPRAVTPWLTAFKAYSAGCQQCSSFETTEPAGQTAKPSAVASNRGGRRTDLDQLPAAKTVSTQSRNQADRTYLGEKVVREKEYLSAMIASVNNEAE